MRLFFIRSFSALSLHAVISLGLSLIFAVLSGYLLFTNAGSFPLAVPLWFSKPWGEERLAEPIFLWLLPTTSLVLVAFNFFLWSFFKNRERLLFLLLLWTSPIVSGLLFYTLLEILLVVSQ